MQKIFVLVAALALSAVAVQAESGSWCYSPKGEKFWGQASSECCRSNGGHMESDRRCYGLSGDEARCRSFYSCCIGNWNSGNHLSDKCY